MVVPLSSSYVKNVTLLKCWCDLQLVFYYQKISNFFRRKKCRLCPDRGIDHFGITVGLMLMHAQYTSRGNKTQRLPGKWRQRQLPFHYDVIPTSHLSPQNGSPAVIQKRSTVPLSGYIPRVLTRVLKWWVPGLTTFENGESHQVLVSPSESKSTWWVLTFKHSPFTRSPLMQRLINSLYIVHAI